MSKQHFSQQAGQMLVELLLTLAIASLVLPALLTGIVSTRQGKAQQIQRQGAAALLVEAAEAVRSVREAGWSGISADGVYHPARSGSTWTLVSGAETVAGYTRTITISSIQRDASGAVVASGGTVDPSTKKVESNVAWLTPATASVDSVSYFTRYLDNALSVNSSVADFTGGTLVNTAITNVSGGEVTLSGSGAGFSDWCKPNLGVNPVDLPKSGVANAISAIQGRVFAGTGDNASGVSYATVSLTDVNPPTGTIINTFSGYKTNALFGETNYAYIGTDNHFKEVVILDISGSSPTEAGYFDAPGNGSGDTVAVSGNTGYMTSGSTFYSFDLTSRTGSRPKLGSAALAGNGKKIFIVGSYAYVAINSAATQLQIVDISNPSSPSVVGSASVNGLAGRDVFVNSTGTRAYLVTTTSATQPEFFILDITNKTGSHSALATYSTSGMDPRGVNVVPGNKAIIVGVGGQEYQVVNIASETNPVLCGGVTVATGIFGIASVKETDGDAFSYIITGDATAELKIIEGFGGNVVSGTYESKTFDALSTAAFNRFVTTTSIPAGTTISYQVAVAPPVSGSCSGASFAYLGPDGTGNTYFTGNSNAIPLLTNGGYQNPGRCFRYKVYMTTNDPSVLPVLDDFTVNYSP